MTSVGMMDPAYFVGKNELLAWLNELLKLSYSKVEQCNSGAAYCQIIDAVYPGEVPLKKVNFNAKHESEYIKNFKVLQAIFEKKQITRHVDVQKLTLPGSSSFIHNLEFLQWIKKYFDTHYGGQPYDAVERRGGIASTSSAPVAKENASRPVASATAVKPTTPGRARPTSAGVARGVGRDVSNNGGGAVRVAASGKEATASKEDKKKLEEEVSSLKFTVEKLESERDFYFGKLREVELICQRNDGAEAAALIDNITRVLYAEDPAPTHA